MRPANCHYLNYEGEIAIVIGRTARNIKLEDAGDYIAGYTIANDFGLHDFRDTDAGSMLRVKGADTLCPLGPGVVTDWDFHSKSMRTSVNGVVRQMGSTRDMIFPIAELLRYISSVMTLEVGDIVPTGTPAGVGAVQPGDRIQVEVDGLGILENKFASQ